MSVYYADDVAREDEGCLSDASDASTEWTSTRTEAKADVVDPTALATSPRFKYEASGGDAGLFDLLGGLA